VGCLLRRERTIQMTAAVSDHEQLIQRSPRRVVDATN
jgi:hypothetical protein